jgi:hypothetical protein
MALITHIKKELYGVVAKAPADHTRGPAGVESGAGMDFEE